MPGFPPKSSHWPTSCPISSPTSSPAALSRPAHSVMGTPASTHQARSHPGPPPQVLLQPGCSSRRCLGKIPHQLQFFPQIPSFQWCFLWPPWLVTKPSPCACSSSPPHLVTHHFLTNYICIYYFLCASHFLRLEYKHYKGRSLCTEVTHPSQRLKYLLNEWMRPDFSHLQNRHNRTHPTHCFDDSMKNMYFKYLAQQGHLPSFRMWLLKEPLRTRLAS